MPPTYTELVAKDKVRRDWLGVSIQPLTPELAKSFGLREAKGVLISDVIHDSPAEKASIAAGDIITDFDTKKVDDPQDLQKVVALTPPGKGVPVTVWRDKTHKTMEIRIGATHRTTPSSSSPTSAWSPTISPPSSRGTTAHF